MGETGSARFARFLMGGGGGGGVVRKSGSPETKKFCGVGAKQPFEGRFHPQRGHFACDLIANNYLALFVLGPD